MSMVEYATKIAEPMIKRKKRGFQISSTPKIPQHYLETETPGLCAQNLFSELEDSGRKLMSV
jgi:hypothetical protein